MTDWCKEHTLTVKGLEVANYMIDHGSEMIGIENIPKSLLKIRMIFRSENVHTVYGQAMSRTLPELTDSEIDRLFSMLSILICAKKQELEEQGGNL